MASSGSANIASAGPPSPRLSAVRTIASTEAESKLTNVRDSSSGTRMPDHGERPKWDLLERAVGDDDQPLRSYRRITDRPESQL